MKVSDVKPEHLKGWKYDITRTEKEYDVMFSHQYRCVVITPDGDRITSLPYFGNDFGVYALSDKRAEKKVLKVIKELIVQEYNRKNPISKTF